MTIFDVLCMIGVVIIATRYVLECDKLSLKTHLYFALGLTLTEIYSIHLFCKRLVGIFVFANSLMFLAVAAIIIATIVERLKQAEHNEDKQAYFITKWDDGSVVITPCNVDDKTKEITDIMQCDCNIGGTLCSEAVLVQGNEYGVRTIEEPYCRRYAKINDELPF